MDYYKESLRMHEENKGKMAVASKVKVGTRMTFPPPIHRALPSRAGRYMKILRMYTDIPTNRISLQ